MPTTRHEISALPDPSADIQHVHTLHRVGIIQGDEVLMPLRRNKGVTNLSQLVNQEVPNLRGHLEVFRAAKLYKIQGLPEAAVAGFHLTAGLFKGHSEITEVVASGLPFPFQP